MTRNINIKIVLVLVLLIISNRMIAQLIVDAGNDTIFCSTSDNTINFELGGVPPAKGGIEPYTYCWHSKIKHWPSSNYIYYASHFLSDTTVGNPHFIFEVGFEQAVTFYLTVKDAANNIGQDSITIGTSRFTSWFGTVTEIDRGESLCFDGATVLGNYPIAKYMITPSLGLTDTLDVFACVKPDSSIRYYIVAEDINGCMSDKKLFYNIIVHDNQSYTKKDYQMIKGISIDLKNLPDGIYDVKIYNVHGKLVEHEKLLSNHINVFDLVPKDHKVYVVQIHGDQLIYNSLISIK